MCIMKAEKELGSFVLDLFIFGATHDQFPITNEMSVPDYLSVYLLKVSKFQKQIFLFSLEPKNEWNYVFNSALASKMSQIKKMKALYQINYGVFNTIEALIFLFGSF